MKAFSEKARRAPQWMQQCGTRGPAVNSMLFEFENDARSHIAVLESREYVVDL